MDNNNIFPLEKVKSMADLGVRFDTNLMFRDHISELGSSAAQSSGRSFMYIKNNKGPNMLVRVSASYSIVIGLRLLIFMCPRLSLSPRIDVVLLLYFIDSSSH